MKKEQIATWFEGLQNRICHDLETTDRKAQFQTDVWTRQAGGGGKTKVIQNGNILEKGGVAFSAVFGKTPEKILQALNLPQADFFATGVSIVLHPTNPFVPIVHMNVRYFEMSDGTYWFGGGIDLTPHYVDVQDAIWFHEQLKNVCDRSDLAFYPKFKTWADDYFYIKHRQETRGIGGIFFDHLKADEKHSFEDLLKFVQNVGETFAPTYTYLMQKNANLPFEEQHLAWQRVRRGRYVEFNLVYDKGTKFGLDTDGRTESILMSLPPQANWLYNFQPEKDSLEAKTLDFLKKDINWLAKK